MNWQTWQTSIVEGNKWEPGNQVAGCFQKFDGKMVQIDTSKVAQPDDLSDIDIWMSMLIIYIYIYIIQVTEKYSTAMCQIDT